MTKKLAKLSFEELSGVRQLNGTYKVSFEISISETENTDVSDVVQSIAAGFEGQDAQSSISHVDMEKVVEIPLEVKAGDMVVFSEDVKVTATVAYDHNLYIVGSSSESAEVLGDVEMTIPHGIKAIVNRVSENEVELIEFDNVLTAELPDELEGTTKAPVVLEKIVLSREFLKRMEK